MWFFSLFFFLYIILETWITKETQQRFVFVCLFCAFRIYSVLFICLRSLLFLRRRRCCFKCFIVLCIYLHTNGLATFIPFLRTIFFSEYVSLRMYYDCVLVNSWKNENKSNDNKKNIWFWMYRIQNINKLIYHHLSLSLSRSCSFIPSHLRLESYKMH